MNEAEERGCDVVRRFFAALSDGDLEAIRPMLHPDATWEVMRAAARRAVDKRARRDHR